MRIFHGRRKILALVLVLPFLGFMTFRTVNKESEVVNPADTINLETDSGSMPVRWLYRYSDLYEVLGNNPNVIEKVEKDIITFARETRSEFNDPETLVGFTFDKGYVKDGDSYVFTGHYYDLGDKIEIRVTPRGRGVYTLSITNLRDGVNIDEQLAMNGRRNKYIQSLPINETYFSIRYLLGEDKVVVSFYEGYSNTDIDKATSSLVNGLGATNGDDVIYSLNRIGIVSLDQIRQNLISPIPTP